jgi:hypothetical protein
MTIKEVGQCVLVATLMAGPFLVEIIKEFAK